MKKPFTFPGNILASIFGSSFWNVSQLSELQKVFLCDAVVNTIFKQLPKKMIT